MGRQQQNTSIRPSQAYQVSQYVENRGLMLLDDIDDENTITLELLAKFARFFLVCRVEKSPK